MHPVSYSRYRKLVLVCTNERSDDVCCAGRGSFEIWQELKATLKAVDPFVRVSKTGCLGHCKSGTSVVIMPDNIWLGSVTKEDIPKIVEMVCGGGTFPQNTH